MFNLKIQKHNAFKQRVFVMATFKRALTKL